MATVAPSRALIPDFAAILAAPADAVTTARMERAPAIGRPLGAPEWIAALEQLLGRRLAPGKPGRKPGMDRDAERRLPLLWELGVNFHRNSVSRNSNLLY